MNHQKSPYIFGTKIIGDPGEITPDEEVALLKKIGFGAFFTAWDPVRIPDYAEAARKHGLIYQSIHAQAATSKIWLPGDEGIRETERLLTEAEYCVQNGVRILVVHPSAGFDLPDPSEIGLRNFARLIRYAEQNGLTVAFENLECDKYLDAVLKHFWSSPACGYCYDTGHAFAYSDNKNFALLYREKLCHTHLHDNLGRCRAFYTSADDLHMLPFDGKIDWSTVMQRLDDAAYRGILMSEVKYFRVEGDPIYDRYHAPSLEDFYTLVYERLLKLTSHAL